ncbi:arylamine N-acetyltransferase [Streptomyces sp. NPDC059009]|uniref:arylamine N-acetyltransferase family protein n=1 Tax=Streptomyces sp. NPDC059009 TaxID=3346694 RepID=UPI003697F4E4
MSPHDPSSTAEFDLDAYLARVGRPGGHGADAAALRDLNGAHLHAIPFENLDPIRGRAPSLAVPDLTAKLVRSARGGYCYEHNTLFATALEALGFGVTRLTARVLVGARGAVRPRTHMLLLVDVPGEEQPYVADAGFGSIGSIVEAMPLVADAEVRVGARRHRLVRRPDGGPLPQWVLQAYAIEAEGSGWQDQYAFTVEPFLAPDFEVINWHIATNPRSPFATGLHAQRLFADRHVALAGRSLVETDMDSGARKERELADGDEVRRVLAAEFGIVAPQDTPLG